MGQGTRLREDSLPQGKCRPAGEAESAHCAAPSFLTVCLDPVTSDLKTVTDLTLLRTATGPRVAQEHETPRRESKTRHTSHTTASWCPLSPTEAHILWVWPQTARLFPLARLCLQKNIQVFGKCFPCVSTPSEFWKQRTPGGEAPGLRRRQVFPEARIDTGGPRFRQCPCRSGSWSRFPCQPRLCQLSQLSRCHRKVRSGIISVWEQDGVSR